MLARIVKNKDGSYYGYATDSGIVIEDSYKDPKRLKLRLIDKGYQVEEIKENGEIEIYG